MPTALTSTTHLTSFTRPTPTSSTFAFPPFPLSPSNPPPPSPTTITLPPQSTYSTTLHWHASHTEFLHIRRGAALLTISGASNIYTKEDGVVEIPRYARHEWMRFDRPSSLLSKHQEEVQVQWMREVGQEAISKYKAIDLVAEEWTSPADFQKEVFFRNLFSTLREPRFESSASILGPVYRETQLMCVTWELDNYPVLVDFDGWKGGWRGCMERGCTNGIMGLMALLGWGVGLRGVNKEYTPEWLLRVWERARVGRSKTD